jgi:hypothetical protein
LKFKNGKIVGFSDTRSMVDNGLPSIIICGRSPQCKLANKTEQKSKVELDEFEN